MAKSTTRDLLSDADDAFEQMLREQFGTSPEAAIDQINRELAANPQTAHLRLELRPGGRARRAGFRLTPPAWDR